MTVFMIIAESFPYIDIACPGNEKWYKLNTYCMYLLFQGSRFALDRFVIYLLSYY